MAPLRRYLRISKYSVLECRIFLENPADESRWLLNERDPALNRVFEAVKPFVLPKLREENERAKGKGKKKKTVKDVVKQDDFEVSIFLTQIPTSHSLLVKNKTFQHKERLKTNNGGKLLAELDNPIMVRDESDDELELLGNIPETVEEDDDHARRHAVDNPLPHDDDDKKKLGMKTTYDGFSIWGWVLCLFIERKGGPGQKPSSNLGGNAQALMQDWIASTQQHNDEEL